VIPNNWKKILAKRKLMQSHFAEGLGINKGTFSRVVAGYQLLPWEDLELCLLHLECTAQDIYPDGVLMFYGIKPKKKPPQKKRTAKRVPMTDTVAAQVDELVELGEFKNRAEAVELIVKKYLTEEHHAVR